MTPTADEPLIAALRDLATLDGAPLRRWERVVRDARQANLLGAIAARIEAAGRLDAVPDGPRRHLAAARVMSRAQEAAVHREILHVQAALADTGVPIVVLKGCAYALAGLPNARGRMFSDVDILVPKTALPAIEAALMLGGWATTHRNPYDQRYYREWMHELPPMQHTKRLTVIDVHHAIAPQTARWHPDSRLLLEAARPIPGHPAFSMLAPTDMLLHCAAHLFQDEELTHGLRDLVDFDALLRHFGATDPGFVDALAARAEALDLVRPLGYGLAWATSLLATPVDPAAVAAIVRAGPPAPTRALMHALLGRALRPTPERASTVWARRLLYVRGHWLKMPAHQLAWHLAVKAVRREPEDETATGQ